MHAAGHLSGPIKNGSGLQMRSVSISLDLESDRVQIDCTLSDTRSSEIETERICRLIAQGEWWSRPLGCMTP